MKENKARKIILWVLFIAIALGIIVRISITGVDTKSKISKQVSVARELIQNADVGNDNGQYSKYRVHLLETGMENAQAVLSNRESSDEEEAQALEDIKSDIEEFKNGENASSLSKEDVGKLIDNKETFERTQDLDDHVQVTMRFRGSNIKEAQPVNPEVFTDGIYMDTLISKVLEQSEVQGVTPIFLAQNDSFPCSVEISLSGLEDKAYKVYFYDEAEDTAREITATQNDGNCFTFQAEEGGDYLLVPKDAETVGQKKEDKEADESKETKETQTQDESSEETVEDDETEGIDETEIFYEYTEENNSFGSPSNSQGGNKGNVAESNTKNDSEETENVRTCFIEIRCDTILDNMDDLREGLEAYVPSNGVILWASEVELTEGETVFDVLKSVTRETGIKLEFRNDAVHGSGYIVGIGNINELDCGSGSGWMYTVNGWFPNYGCKKYVVEDGDVIQWIYTCDLGRDIGGNFWETN